MWVESTMEGGAGEVGLPGCNGKSARGLYCKERGHRKTVLLHSRASLMMGRGSEALGQFR